MGFFGWFFLGGFFWVGFLMPTLPDSGWAPRWPCSSWRSSWSGACGCSSWSASPGVTEEEWELDYTNSILTAVLFPVFRIRNWIRIGSGFNHVSWSVSGFGIRLKIRIQEGKKMTHKSRKRSEISCFEVLNVLFWGLKDSTVAWASFLEA